MESKKTVSKLIYILPILWAIVFRCAIGLYSHSGQGKGSLFGDFEAQRHWMEITINLPISDWYHNSTSNDLNYWGLDYPPLTAYHSYALGLIAHARNESWTKLFISRGIETLEIKSIMRTFVLLSDCIIYIPALCILYFYTIPRVFGIVSELDVVVCALFYPGIVLIDHGHFQYNCVSLGLFLFTSICMLHDHDIAASVFFCLALLYKQMELYHAIPIFCLLLARSFRSRPSYLIKIATTVVITFLAILSPFLLINNTVDEITTILSRLFPISRGLFEDKVSNIWCALSPFIKWHTVPPSFMVTLCALTTLVVSLPSCVTVLASPRKLHRYLYSSFIVSLGFFLCSYQVHEKSILIPAVSAILLSSLEPFWSLSFLHFSTLSMWPLLLKDGLAFPTVVSCVMFIVLFAKQISLATKLERFTFFCFNIGYALIIGLSLIVDPPSRYLFLYALLISQWSCLVFVVHFLYFNWRIFTKR